jgi:hypothetical protein
VHNCRSALAIRHHVSVTGDSARSTYELRITDPSAVDHDKALAKTVLANLLSAGSGGWEAPVPAKVGVHIVDRRTGQIVFTRHVDPETAHLLTADIDENLDRFDAVGFAREWGIGVDAAEAPELRLRGVKNLARVPGLLLRQLFSRGNK